MSGFAIRQATLEDCSALQQLIQRSARKVGGTRYTEQQIEGALRGAFGVDRTDAAKIRAFFVDPAHLRKGIASALLERCERAAREAGFLQVELMGTLTGVPFYEARGYARAEPVSYEIEPGLRIDFAPMSKRA